MQNRRAKYLSLIIIIGAFIALVYATIRAVDIASKTQIGTGDGIYTSYISSSKEIQNKAKALTQNCSTKLCQVQSLLDYVTNIPYHTETFQRYSASKTMAQNFGDCDDKSNLLISLLHSQKIEAYFVLVPEHIFVIVPLEDTRLKHTKGLWLNGRKYYILESTAKDSQIGFPLKYTLEEIDSIIEPFANEKMKVERLRYGG